MILFLGIFLKKLKASKDSNRCDPYLYQDNSQEKILEAVSLIISRWIKKMWYIYSGVPLGSEDKLESFNGMWLVLRPRCRVEEIRHKELPV